MKNVSLKCFPSFLRKPPSSQRNIVQHSLRQIHLLKKMINDIYGSQWTGLPAGIGLMFESWFWSYHQPWSWLYSHYLHDSSDLPKICLTLLIPLIHLKLTAACDFVLHCLVEDLSESCHFKWTWIMLDK